MASKPKQPAGPPMTLGNIAAQPEFRKLALHQSGLGAMWASASTQVMAACRQTAISAPALFTRRLV